MTNVTFPDDNSTWGDGDGATTDRQLGNGGHRTWLLPLVQRIIDYVSGQVAAIAASAGSASTSAGVASGAAGAAAASETAAQAYAAALHGTSVTSLAIGIGARVFETQAAKQFVAGQFVEAVDAADPTNWMWGQVTAYAGTTLTVDVQAIGGAGTIADWRLSVSGSRGAVGPAVAFAASARLLGRLTAGAGAAEELTLSDALDLVGGAAHGDVLFRGAAQWSRLAAGTTGLFLQTHGPGADPAWAAVAAGDQLALSNLRLLLASSVSSGALAQGYQWELGTDEWGASSSSASFVAGTPNYYVTHPGGLLDTYASSNAANSYDLWSATAYAGVAQGLAIASATTITQVKFWAQKIGSPTGNAVAKIYAASGSVGSTAVPSGAALATSDAVSVSGVSGTLGWVTFTFSTPYAAAAGNYAIAVEYTAGSSGNALRVYCDASAPTHGGNLASLDSSWTARGGEDLVFELYNAAATAMTLVSPSAVPVSTAPTAMVCYLLYKDDSGSAVLGTDFTIELSRDNGATWTVATLTAVAAYDGTYAVIKARADVSGQPSGTQMLARIKTLNGKSQRVAAPALYKE